MTSEIFSRGQAFLAQGTDQFLNKMLSIRKVRLLITSRYISMQSYECVIISKMFLIYFISYGCNGGALVFLGGAEASASPSFALPMFITIKKIIILHLFLGVPAATVGGTGTPWHTRGYAPALSSRITNWSAAQIGIKPSLHIKGAMNKRERWERNETKQACKYCICIEKVLVFIHITMWSNLPKKMSLISQLFLLDGDDIKWRSNVGCILLIVLLKIMNISFSLNVKYFNMSISHRIELLVNYSKMCPLTVCVSDMKDTSNHAALLCALTFLSDQTCNFFLTDNTTSTIV